MAMEIDLTKPLNEDEIKYLVERCRWRDLRMYAANMGLDEPMLPDAAGIRRADPLVGVNASELPGAYKALVMAGEGQAANVPPPSEQPAGAPTGDVRQFPSQPQAIAGQGGPVVKTDWTQLTVPQLKQELDSRREEAQKEDPPDPEVVDLLSYTNDDRKDDLVAKLNLDDEAIARANAENSDDED